MEDRRLEDKRIEINRRLREIQDEVALNKKVKNTAISILTKGKSNSSLMI